MKRIIALLILSGFVLTACASGLKITKTEPESALSARKLQKKAMDNYQRGCDAAALEYLFQAHELFSLADQVNSVAVCLNNIGKIYQRSGNIDDAVLFYDEAAVLFERTGDSAGVAQTTINKAAALLQAEQLEKAEAVLDQAAALLSPTSRFYGLILSHRAILMMKKADHATAEKLFRQAASLNSDPEMPAYGTINAGLGNLMLELHRYEEALEFFQNAYTADRRHENVPAMADDLSALATACLALERFDEAMDYLKRSLTLYALTGKILQAHSQFEKLIRIADERNQDISVIRYFARKWLGGEISLKYCR